MAWRLEANRSPPPAGLVAPRSRIASSLFRFLSRIEGPMLWQSRVEQGRKAATGSDDEVNEGIWFSFSPPLCHGFLVILLIFCSIFCIWFWWCFGVFVKLYQWFCEIGFFFSFLIWILIVRIIVFFFQKKKYQF